VNIGEAVVAAVAPHLDVVRVAPALGNGR